LEKDFPSKWPNKQLKVGILISDKVDLKLKLLRRDKGGQFILIKGVIYEKEITVVNLYAPNVGAHNFIKHILL
jgi:hypothetical protein